MRPARARRARAHQARPTDMFRAMYWPLIGALIAFVLLAVFMGWVLDPKRRGEQGNDHS